VRDGQWQIADLNSSNGTFVNGAKVTKATLKAGDAVRLGSVEFRVAGKDDKEMGRPEGPEAGKGRFKGNTGTGY
jgi:pSer/pThr/pTyr-binding forkhead associated (FHA) protein